jgi:peptidoglycan hydrolase-like protein with peptidoglycan-binding domain
MHDPPPSSDEKLLQEGSQGVEVRDIQSFLNALGAHLKVDGIFGPATEQAVRQFQTAHHLASDGIVGPMTWTALDTALVSASNSSSHTADSGNHWSAENDIVVREMISAALQRHGNDPKFAYLEPEFAVTRHTCS